MEIGQYVMVLAVESGEYIALGRVESYATPQQLSLMPASLGVIHQKHVALRVVVLSIEDTGDDPERLILAECLDGKIRAMDGQTLSLVMLQRAVAGGA